MLILDPGHRYLLLTLDDDKVHSPVELRFVKRVGPDYPGNIGAHGGTTTQEVLRALIDRTKYVDNQIPSFHNMMLLFHLRKSIFELETRAAERHGRTPLPLSLLDGIEDMRTCPKCQHIGCVGTCR